MEYEMQKVLGGISRAIRRAINVQPKLQMRFRDTQGEVRDCHFLYLDSSGFFP